MSPKKFPILRETPSGQKKTTIMADA